MTEPSRDTLRALLMELGDDAKAICRAIRAYHSETVTHLNKLPVGPIARYGHAAFASAPGGTSDVNRVDVYLNARSPDYKAALAVAVGVRAHAYCALLQSPDYDYMSDAQYMGACAKATQRAVGDMREALGIYSRAH